MTRRWSSKAWRWSLVVTLPATALLVNWCLSTARHYYDFKIRFKTLKPIVSLHRIGELEAAHMSRRVELALKPRPARYGGDLRQIDLFLGETHRKQLEEHLPLSGRDYHEAHLTYPDGAVRKVSLKYRGDFFWHWAGFKKSMRVKTKKKNLYERMRSFNLIAPKYSSKINTHLSLELARLMGLVAPHSEMVNVSLNGRNRGLYLLVEQLEEMVLRKNDLMPGDLYTGEIIARDAYTGLTGALFEHPGVWEKVAVNNHYPAQADAPIRRLCELLQQEPSDERSAALRGLLDIDAFGRFSAFCLLVQSLHYDDHHNWRLYYDPWRNALVPVVWDPAPYNRGWLPKSGNRAHLDMVASRLDEVLLQDQQYLLARHDALRDYFESGIHEQYLQIVDGCIESVRTALEWDPALIVNYKYQPPQHAVSSMQHLRRVIVRLTDDLRSAYLSGGGTLRYAVQTEEPLRIRLEVDGRRPVDRVELSFLHAITGSVDARLSWKQNGETREADVSGAVVRHGSRLELAGPLTADFEMTVDRDQMVKLLQRELRALPATYDLLLEGPGLVGNEMVGLQGAYGDKAVVPGQLVGDLESQAFVGRFGVVEAVPGSAAEVWSGEKLIEGVRTIRQDLVIEPGTAIRMGPASCLILEGRLIAKGTEADPIRVSAASSEQEPWGTLALRGPGASGSVLQHCRVSGGSGYKVPLAEYSAMFSIHDVPEVTVENCVFADNHVVDDMVHAVYSNVSFRDCAFERAVLDAIDLDISEGVLVRCRVSGSGNDALDLMTTSAVIRDCLLLDSGDKGISVGEDSSVLVINTEIARCDIGVQPKDRSKAVLYNVDLTDNRMAVDAYKKNWRYDSGGFGYLYKCNLSGNESSLSTDKASRIAISDSYVDRRIEPSKRIQIRDVDGENPRRARTRRHWRFPEDKAVPVPLFRPFWKNVDPNVRGVRRVE